MPAILLRFGNFKNIDALGIIKQLSYFVHFSQETHGTISKNRNFCQGLKMTEIIFQNEVPDLHAGSGRQADKQAEETSCVTVVLLIRGDKMAKRLEVRKGSSRNIFVHFRCTLGISEHFRCTLSPSIIHEREKGV